MKFCTQCGAANENDMTICYACGAMLEPDSGSTGKPRGSFRIPKSVLAIGGIVIAVALIVGCVFWVISSLQGGVDDALDQTMKEFVGDKREPTQFRRFFTVANDRLTEGEYTMSASFSGGFLDLQMNTDYSRSAWQLRGDLSLGNFDLEYSAEKDVIQIRFPGEYEVYGFDAKDINKITGLFNDMLNMPLVKNLLPIDLPTNLKLDLFAKGNMENLLAGIAGEEYEAFRKSLKVENWNDETILRGGRNEKCQVYKISWSAEALADLLGAVGSGGILPNVGGLVNTLLPEMDPYLFCYVNSEDYLVGVRFTAAGAKCFFLLEGQENLWDSFTLTAETMSGQIKTCRGAMERNGEAFRLYLNGEDGQSLICVEYDDASGDFALYTAAAGELIRGNVTAKVGEAAIRLNWSLPEIGAQELSWSISRLRQQPQQLGEQPSDLMSKAWMIIENIISELLTN